MKVWYRLLGAGQKHLYLKLTKKQEAYCLIMGLLFL